MQKSALILLASACFLFAETNYEKAYFGLSQLEEKNFKIFMEDPDYKQGNEYLNNDALKQPIKVNAADPHASTQDIKTLLFPNYVAALENFQKSAQKTNNPLAAYAGNYIIKTYTNKQGVDQLKQFVLFSETLYSQKVKICQAYLDMGEVYENGYLRKAEIKKAWEIYSEGLKDPKCNKGWAASVLASKKMKLEKM